MRITSDDLEAWFTYHPPSPADVVLYQKIRDAGRVFAEVIVDCTPSCADQSAAIRHVREAVMTANAALACGLADPVPHPDRMARSGAEWVPIPPLVGPHTLTLKADDVPER